MNKKLVIIDGLSLNSKGAIKFSAYEKAESYSYLNINLVHTRLHMIQKQFFCVIVIVTFCP